MALRQNGGIEKPLDGDSLQQDNANADRASEDEDAYVSDDSMDDEENAIMDGQPQAGPSNPPMDKKSKSIPKGFARIIRDDKGNVIDVVMSAYDESDEEAEQEETAQSAEQVVENDNSEDEETPWGKPLVSREHERQLKKAAKHVPAKSAGLRGGLSSRHGLELNYD